MVTVWSCLIHYSFLNHSETITSEKCAQQINEMQQILQHLQLILLNRRGPILLHDNIRTRHTTDASKVEQIGLQSLVFIHHNLLTTHSNYTSSIILTAIHQENASTTSRRQKCFPRIHQIPKHKFLHYRNKPTLSHWKNCADYKSSYFD